MHAVKQRFLESGSAAGFGNIPLAAKQLGGTVMSENLQQQASGTAGYTNAKNANSGTGGAAASAKRSASGNSMRTGIVNVTVHAGRTGSKYKKGGGKVAIPGLFDVRVGGTWVAVKVPCVEWAKALADVARIEQGLQKSETVDERTYAFHFPGATLEEAKARCSRFKETAEKAAAEKKAAAAAEKKKAFRGFFSAEDDAAFE
jgi:hypothetical protein